MGIAAGIAAGAAVAGAAAGIGSDIAGSGGTNAFGGSGFPIYQPQYQGSADGLYATGFPLLNTAVSNVQNNPFAGQAQTYANTAGAYGTGTLAPAEQGAAASLFGLGQQAAPYASQILQTGFDPQNALYNQTQNQISQQLNAQNAMSGLGGTPYGAAVAGQGLTNFNIDWQNQQLQRQATALQGYQSGVGAIGSAYSGAAGLGTQGASTLNTYGSLPYNTYLGQQTNDINAIGNLGSYAAPYLGFGNAAQGLGLSANNAAFAQQQAQMNNLQSGLGGIEGLFGGADLSSLFGSSPDVSSFLGAGGAASTGPSTVSLANGFQ